MGAQVLVENTSFTGVDKAIVTNLDSKEQGFANERNNVFTSSTTQITQKVRSPYEYPWKIRLLTLLIGYLDTQLQVHR